MCTFAKDELQFDELDRVLAAEAQTKCEIIQMRKDDGKIFPTLINGKAVDRADWLEVVRIGDRSCTATMVGPRIAVTAAHCGRNNGRTNVEIYNDRTYDGVMIHMPQWRNRSDYDLAVVVLDDEVEVPFADVDLNHQFATGQDVDIAGYGCIQPGGGGGNDGILRFGESKVVSFTGTDVVTQWRPNGGALCFGDSGGPMFADGSDRGNVRKLIAINSKGNIRDTNYNMRLSVAGVSDFFKSIADRYQLEIYGFNKSRQPDDNGGGGNDDPSQPGCDWRQQQIEYFEQIESFYRERKLALMDCTDNAKPDPNNDGGYSYGL
jgi:hypothetical protein